MYRGADAFGALDPDKAGSITEQQRTFRKLVSQHLQIEETDEQLDEQLA